METNLAIDSRCAPSMTIDQENSQLVIDVSRPGKFRVLAIGAIGEPKEYFLKVTERKGLVLV